MEDCNTSGIAWKIEPSAPIADAPADIQDDEEYSEPTAAHWEGMGDAHGDTWNQEKADRPGAEGCDYYDGFMNARNQLMGNAPISSIDGEEIEIPF